MEGPVPKIIITYGAQHPQKEFIEWWIHKTYENDVCWFDLRQSIPDPRNDTQVKHGDDGSCAETISAVYAHEQFEVVVKAAVLDVTCRLTASVVVGKCTTGHHRADTFGKTVAALTAAITNKDSPQFVVCHFPLHKITKKIAVERSLDDSMQFMNEPWVRPSSIIPRERQYGYAETQRNAAAHRTFNELWDYANSMCITKVDEPAEPSERSRSPRKSESVKDSAPRSPPPRKTKSRKSPSRSPPPRRPASEKNDKNDNRKSRKPSRSPKPHRPRLPTPPHAPPRAAPKWGESAGWQQHLHDDSGAGASSSANEEWVQWRKHFEDELCPIYRAWCVPGPVELGQAWGAVLRGWGVDEDAAHNLLLLSQSSVEGAMKANGIVATLVKKRCDGETVRNPSGFVHSSVMNSRFGDDYAAERAERKRQSAPKW